MNGRQGFARHHPIARMGLVSRYPAPDRQTGYDALANWLGLFTAVEDVHADQQESDVDFVLIDTRPHDAYQAGHIAGAMHVPLPTLNEEVARRLLPVGTLAVVYDSGFSTRAEQAAVLLAALGHAVKILAGGFDAWRRAGLAIHSSATGIDAAPDSRA